MTKEMNLLRLLRSLKMMRMFLTWRNRVKASTGLPSFVTEMAPGGSLTAQTARHPGKPRGQGKRVDLQGKSHQPSFMVFYGEQP